MSKPQINFIGTFDRIKNEDDLHPKPGININPPPKEGRCDCCGRHISELKPFGKAGDPLVGDFDGALLIKTFRRMGTFNEEAEKAVKEAEKHLADAGYKDKDPLEWMIKKYGKEKGRNYDFSYQAYCQIGSSWECRDCVVLDTDEYFEKYYQSLSEEN